ncbi:glycogen synthase GlgA [Ideonella azotifigens]|uniref:Glycogen synthase n=1 Tax=Ideonella azotifigens TaxID=513160 RepID=A0ABN1K180_9BURK|nr:glycogen synthase GlgA [Ideonella azotifigens]MCD2341677.1 glycogen synthase GlgA [Ideonella azotifigens]
MRVLQVCAEIFPLLKTGGLADVAGALPAALQAAGADARVLLPGFDAVLAGLTEPALVAELPARGQVPAARLLYGQLPAANTSGYVIESPALYQRAGGPYADGNQQPYADNHLRFARLGWAAAELAQGADAYWRPALVHAHDWHAGLAPACLRALGSPAASVFTIHNLAYQGSFDARHFAELGLPPEFFGVDGVEFHGGLNFMKAGLFFADHLSTVSPTYAREIQQPEQGMGLDGLLRTRSAVLHGILNGVDPAVWDPAHDPAITATYEPRRLGRKALNKAALQAAMGLALVPDSPLFIVVSRLTEQKGLHLVQAAVPGLVACGAQFALLGSGDPGMEAAFRKLAEETPASVAVRIGYDELFAHQLVAGGDVIMVPSRFEPCGLTQLYGLRYGTLPLVRRVGGLADTVTDCSLEALDDGSATGMVFDSFDEAGLATALRRALALYRRPRDWRAVQRNAMAQRHDWGVAAEAYLAMYRAALGH